MFAAVVQIPFAKLIIGDASEALRQFPSGSVDLCMTSPPYWGLRDYGVEGQLGLESKFQEYNSKLTHIFCKDIWRVLKPSGSFYLNLGDIYARSSGAGSVEGVPKKSLVGMPWRIALQLIDHGWALRNDVIWYKPNHMPSSAKDRLSNSYEHLFHFVKSPRYYYDLDAIRVPHKPASIQRMALEVKQGLKPKVTKYTPDRVGQRKAQGGKYFVPSWVVQQVKEQQKYGGALSRRVAGNGYHLGVRRDSGAPINPLGRNPGDLWSISTRSFRGAHFAVYPETLCVWPILSSSPVKVCSKCGSPGRKLSSGYSAKPFNIRYRDGQSGRLARKWGNLVRAPGEAARRYDEANYAVRSTERVVWPGCRCNAGFQPAMVLDPFAGSCTTLKVALDFGRNAIGIDINPAYVEVAKQRTGSGQGGVLEVADLEHVPECFQLA